MPEHSEVQAEVLEIQVASEFQLGEAIDLANPVEVRDYAKLGTWYVRDTGGAWSSYKIEKTLVRHFIGPYCGSVYMMNSQMNENRGISQTISSMQKNKRLQTARYVLKLGYKTRMIVRPCQQKRQLVATQRQGQARRHVHRLLYVAEGQH